MSEFLNTELFTWVILPLLIFLARVCDVSLGTIRIIFLARGQKLLAPLLGFFEILIWLLAIRQIFLNLANPVCFIAYAGGFAMGNYVGMLIEDKLAIGDEGIRIITQKDATELINHLKSEGYGLTILDAQGTQGNVHLIFTVVHRRDLPDVVKIIHKHNQNAFYSVEDLRSVRRGVFPSRKNKYHRHKLFLRNGKDR